MSRGLIFILLVFTLQGLQGYNEHMCSDTVFDAGEMNWFYIPDGCDEGEFDHYALPEVGVKITRSKPIQLCVGLSTENVEVEVTPYRNFKTQWDHSVDITSKSRPVCECSSDGNIDLRMYLIDGYDDIVTWYKVNDI